MENKDIQEILDSPCRKRRIRRRSSLYGSPLSQNKVVPDNSKLQYIAHLQNEKSQWLRFQENVVADSKKVESPIVCDLSLLNPELVSFCKGGVDMPKFIADTKAFTTKFQFYKQMERHSVQKVIYAEDRLKERVDEITAKLYVNQVEDKIYL